MNLLLPQEPRYLLDLQPLLLLLFEFDLLVSPDQFISGVQLLNLNSCLRMREVIIRDMPHQKLHIVSILLDEVIPRETCVLSTVDLIHLPMKNKLHELFLIEYRHLQNFQLNGLAVIDTLPNELKIDDRLVTIEILILILDLEDEFIDRILHSDDHPIILKYHPIDSSYHFIHPKSPKHVRCD